MPRASEELIRLSCLEILRELKQNGLKEKPTAIVLTELSTKGSLESRMDRIEEILIYLDKHNEKITEQEFNTLVIYLMKKYPSRIK